MRFLARLLTGLLLTLLVLWMAGGLFYWLGWPEWLRQIAAVIWVPLALGLWFAPKHIRRPPRALRRAAVVLLLAIFFAAYFSKSPHPRDWVPLHDKMAIARIDGDMLTIENFRDATHYPRAADGTVRPPAIEWQDRTFDLSKLTGADIVLQPFGDSALTVHVLITFQFADGVNLAASVEARRVTWDHFDTIAGFFRHDQLYIVLGTETDLFGKRLAKGEELYFYPTQASIARTRGYLEHLLAFTTEIHTDPAFYSTLTESCLTTLLKLSPEFNEVVPWYDYRRWVPGYVLGLFQEIGLVDNSVPEETLEASARLDPGVTQPYAYNGDLAGWSAMIREHLGSPAAE